ncbi:hypothetical protein KEJ15_06590 [Candidatus Bathyarchaeota archaeon]|nr:hypothetical protein [Candidatus Bathyarchaeota archaeon]
MSKRNAALSSLKFLTLAVALTFLAIASATYLKDAVGVGSRAPITGSIPPYGQLFNVWYFTTQKYHISFQTTEDNFEGVLIVKSMYGDFTLERQIKNSMTLDFTPSTRGFYTVNVTSIYPNEAPYSFSISWKGTELEEEIIVPAIAVSFVFMVATIILDIGVRTIERSRAH